MSELVGWIAAEAGLRDGGGKIYPQPRTTREGQLVTGGSSRSAELIQEISTHNLPPQTFPYDDGWQETALDRNPDLWLYRKRTVGLLRRYMRLAIETGRLPSAVGREFFRTTVTSYKSTTFEDRVIFVRDVEMCLNRLDYWDQQLIARVILQGHNHGDAAYLLHCCRKTIERRITEVIDLLSEDFLRVRLIEELPVQREEETEK